MQCAGQFANGEKVVAILYRMLLIDVWVGYHNIKFLIIMLDLEWYSSSSYLAVIILCGHYQKLYSFRSFLCQQNEGMMNNLFLKLTQTESSAH